MANLIPTAVRNTPGLSRAKTGIDMSQFNKFPGLDQKYVDEIEERTKGVPALYKDSMQQQMYSDYYQQQQMDEQQGQRLSVKNGAIQRAMNSSDKEERDLLNTEVRKADLADLIRRKYNISTTAGDDDAIIDKFVSQVPNGAKLYWQYMEGKNADLLSKSGIISPIFAQLNEQNKVKFNNNVVKQEDMEQTNLVSSSQFDNPDYANQYLKEQDSSYDKFINQAKSQGYSEGEIASIIDGSKKYQEYLKQVEEFNNRPLSDKIGVGGETPLGVIQGFSNFFINSYNNLLGENPTVGAFKPIDKVNAASGLGTDYDPTGEMRADSRWTKGGDIAGKVGAAILTDQALLKLLPGMQAENLTSESVKQIAKEGGKSAVKDALVGRTLQGAAEGGLAGFVNSIGEEDAQETMKTTIPLGIGAGAVGGYIQGKNAIKDSGVLVPDKIANSTEEANKIAGRIGQGEIDDQKKVVESVKSITERNGIKNTKDIKTYNELENAIKKTEKQIIKEEDDLLKQFPEKIKDWNTTQTIKGVGDQTDDITRDYLDEGIELLKKYNKNDPAALKELEMLQNIKNTEGLTRLEAKQLARNLSSKLSKKFYNSNDELRNSMSAESFEAIRKGIQNAVRDRLPNDTLKNLDIEYSNLKALEGLSDDMAEKVNTLTQKLKDVGPIEKLGKKIGDFVNFVTGKGIKGFVEKFLPSNMGNKINNSIDMQAELSKNLGKLVDLNKAIDDLNKVLTSDASKAAISSAINKFANAFTVATNDLINNKLDK